MMCLLRAGGTRFIDHRRAGNERAHTRGWTGLLGLADIVTVGVLHSDAAAIVDVDRTSAVGGRLLHLVNAGDCGSVGGGVDGALVDGPGRSVRSTVSSTSRDRCSDL
jgi:hypothetical protein